MRITAIIAAICTCIAVPAFAQSDANDAAVGGLLFDYDSTNNRTNIGAAKGAKDVLRIRYNGTGTEFIDKVWVKGELDRAAYTITPTEGASKGYTHYQSDGTAYDSTALVVNHANFGTATLLSIQTITSTIIPAAEATGWDVTADGSAAADDSHEVLGGILGASGRPFIIGTDPAFQLCVTQVYTDISGSDFSIVGFRQLEIGAVAAAAHTTYTDFAGIGSISGDIKTTTDLADAGEVTTDIGITNIADGETVIFCTLVSATGVTTHTVDGAAATDAVAYTFADGLLVVPFYRILQNTDIAEDSLITKWEVKWTE